MTVFTTVQQLIVMTESPHQNVSYGCAQISLIGMSELRIFARRLSSLPRAFCAGSVLNDSLCFRSRSCPIASHVTAPKCFFELSQSVFADSGDVFDLVPAMNWEHPENGPCQPVSDLVHRRELLVASRVDVNPT